MKGHFKETGTAEFDLVDGVAYTASDWTGTVVSVTSKAIASPVLAGSPCPMTEARSLKVLRNSGWAEITVDSKGRSNYFAGGTTFDGSMIDKSPGGQYWRIQLRRGGADRLSGTVRHVQNGHFDFDLPVSKPEVHEVSEFDRSQGRRSDSSAPPPAERAVMAAYLAVREAALGKDLKALLAAQGFGQKQIAAIRGLEGIDADLDVFADRFLDPATPGEFSAKPGSAYVRTEGANSKGKKFANSYHFNPCGDRLVLASISENPQ